LYQSRVGIVKPGLESEGLEAGGGVEQDIAEDVVVEGNSRHIYLASQLHNKLTHQRRLPFKILRIPCPNVCVIFEVKQLMVSLIKKMVTFRLRP